MCGPPGIFDDQWDAWPESVMAAGRCRPEGCLDLRANILELADVERRADQHAVPPGGGGRGPSHQLVEVRPGCVLPVRRGGISGGRNGLEVGQDRGILTVVSG